MSDLVTKSEFEIGDCLTADFSALDKSLKFIKVIKVSGRVILVDLINYKKVSKTITIDVVRGLNVEDVPRGVPYRFTEENRFNEIENAYKALENIK